MKNVTVTVNKRNLNAVVRKSNFNNNGTFVSYQFIGIIFNLTKDSTAKFYESTQASENSWTNNPGIKIWDNDNNATYKKSAVLEECEEFICEHLESKINSQLNTDTNFKVKLIGF